MDPGFQHCARHIANRRERLVAKPNELERGQHRDRGGQFLERVVSNAEVDQFDQPPHAQWEASDAITVQMQGLERRAVADGIGQRNEPVVIDAQRSESRQTPNAVRQRFQAIRMQGQILEQRQLGNAFGKSGEQIVIQVQLSQPRRMSEMRQHAGPQRRDCIVVQPNSLDRSGFVAVEPRRCCFQVRSAQIKREWQ